MDSAHERLLFTICDTSKSEPVSAAKLVKFLYAKQRATKPGQNFFSNKILLFKQRFTPVWTDSCKLSAKWLSLD